MPDIHRRSDEAFSNRPNEVHIHRHEHSASQKCPGDCPVTIHQSSHRIDIYPDDVSPKSWIDQGKWDAATQSYRYPQAGKPDCNEYDAVNHPAHYGGDTPYEVIKVLEAWHEMFKMALNITSAIKYLARAGRKPGVSRKQDLEKAVWHISREISHEAEREAGINRAAARRVQ